MATQYIFEFIHSRKNFAIILKLNCTCRFEVKLFYFQKLSCFNLRYIVNCSILIFSKLQIMPQYFLLSLYNTLAKHMMYVAYEKFLDVFVVGDDSVMNHHKCCRRKKPMLAFPTEAIKPQIGYAYVRIYTYTHSYANTQTYIYTVRRKHTNIHAFIYM